LILPHHAFHGKQFSDHDQLDLSLLVDFISLCANVFDCTSTVQFDTHEKDIESFFFWIFPRVLFSLTFQRKHKQAQETERLNFRP
jgi:hypothetical protein